MLKHLIPLAVSNIKRNGNFESVRKYYIHFTASLKCLKKVEFIYINRKYCHKTEKKSDSLTKVQQKDVGFPTTIKKVKETTKTVSYLGVIVLGVGLTGILFYAIFRELFSRKSPNNVYTAALEKCISEQKIKDILGEPIKGYGEETRRGRRRHVSHLEYEKDGVKYLRMKFYIQGLRRKASVHLEMKENVNGDYVYRYLFVQLDSYPRSTIILEDNRDDVGNLTPLDAA